MVYETVYDRQRKENVAKGVSRRTLFLRNELISFMERKSRVYSLSNEDVEKEKVISKEDKYHSYI